MMGPTYDESPRDQRVVDGQAHREELQLEADLRPRNLNEYVGQSSVKQNMEVYLEAARRRRRPLDHVLLAGPPGLGKTSLAHVIAQEMGATLRQTSGPAIERAGDLAALLTHLESGDVLFVDEIHRLGTVVEEVLYPAMEDFSLDITIGQGPGARSVKVDLPPFTLIGATTRSGLLSAPLRSRFGIIERLDIYPADDLRQIVVTAADRLQVPVDSDAAEVIARRSRGTPRIALRLLRRLRDFADVKGEGRITMPIAEGALEQLGVDSIGLDALDRQLLKIIIEHHGGGPVGLGTLAASLGEESDTLEEVAEPYLIQIGFIERTPRGRQVTRRAHEHLGTSGPGETTGRLF